MSSEQVKILNILVDRLKQGEESAFSEIYELFESPIINHLYKMLGSQQKAEEIFQEVMILMIKKIDFYENKKELKNSFKAWVFRIATNAAIDELRRSKKHVTVSIDEINASTKDISDQIEKNDFNVKLSELIMALPNIQRTFLNLRIKEDMSHKEIATICGCNIGAVKQGLFRARKSLKDLIIKEGMSL